MQQSTVTLIVAGIGILGTLGGIVVGHLLTRSWQRKQWLLDCRKQEFKEVVTAMSAYVIEHMHYVAAQGTDAAQSKQSYIEAAKAAGKVLSNRIYIHADLERHRIPHRFLDVMDNFREAGKDFGAPSDKVSELIAEVISIALKG